MADQLRLVRRLLSELRRSYLSCKRARRGTLLSGVSAELQAQCLAHLGQLDVRAGLGCA